MKPDEDTIRFEQNRGVPERRRAQDWLVPFIIAAIVSVCLVSPGLSGQSSKPTEYQVKAAYVFNFGKFVKWPSAAAANQNGPFSICVLDEDTFGSVLESTLTGQSIGGNPVTVKRIAKPQDATGCRILFISSADESRLRGILATLGQASVLTVSDIPDFSKRGGMIQFVLEGDRVRFEVNLASAEEAGLTLSSDLLKVAAAVRGPARNGDK
jgi:hypothetical protein